MTANPRCFVVASIFAAALGGCRTINAPPPHLEGGVEVALRRGSAWSMLTVRPPYISGASTNLKLQRGVLTGSINFHGVNIRIDADGASGMGPTGPVAIDFEETADAWMFDGTWNGARANFKVTAESFRGTIALSSPGVDPGSGRMSLGTTTCQYVLDHVEPDGSRSGISICGALPEETLLEVPTKIQKWLTKPELVVVLLALLSAPPFTVME